MDEHGVVAAVGLQPLPVQCHQQSISGPYCGGRVISRQPEAIVERGADRPRRLKQRGRNGRNFQTGHVRLIAVRRAPGRYAQGRVGVAQWVKDDHQLAQPGARCFQRFGQPVGVAEDAFRLPYGRRVTPAERQAVQPGCRAAVGVQDTQRDHVAPVDRPRCLPIETNIQRPARVG